MRRATSPSINTDKSLKEIRPPPREDVRPSVLAVHQSAGVSKKTKPTRKSQMSAKARRRHERGLEMAEAITERTGKKLEKSFGKARTVQFRSRAWEEINEAVEAGEEYASLTKKEKAARKKKLADEAGLNAEENDWETDDEMDAPGGTDAQMKSENAAAQKSSFAVLPVVDDDDDVIL